MSGMPQMLERAFCEDKGWNTHHLSVKYARKDSINVKHGSNDESLDRKRYGMHTAWVTV